MKNSMIIGGMTGKCQKTRYFKYEDFDVSLAQGFCALKLCNNKVYVHVVDTYGQHTMEEQQEYENNGYILLGYALG